jgi:hypothetical protein
LGEVAMLKNAKIQKPENFSDDVGLSPLLSPVGTKPFLAAALRFLRSGLFGYRHVLENLSEAVSPAEADMARKRSQSGLVLLCLAILFAAILWILSKTLQERLSSYAYELFLAWSLLAPAALVSIRFIPFAGRFLFMAMTLLSFYDVQVPTWSAYEISLLLIKELAISFSLGLVIDLGASREPERKFPELRPWLLLAFGLWQSIEICKSSAQTGEMLWIALAASLLLSFWGWLPIGQRFTKEMDVNLIYLIALVRWARLTIGRTLAAVVGVLPLFLFVTTFDIDIKLHWPKDGPKGGEEVIRTVGPAGSNIWFWKNQSKFLTEADLRNGSGEFYGFAQASPQKRKEIFELVHKVRESPGDEKMYLRLRSDLSQFRLDSGKRFSDIWRGKGDPDVFYLEKNTFRGTSLGSQARELFVVDEPLQEGMLGLAELISYTKEEVLSRTQNVKLRQTTLISCSFLGIFILWRRGGDLPIARWLGIWLVAVATVGSYRYSIFSIPALVYRLWHLALSSPLHNLVMSLVMLVDTVARFLIYGFWAFIPCAGVFMVVCWPTDEEKYSTHLKYAVAVTGKIALIAACMSIAFWGVLGFLTLPALGASKLLTAGLPALVFIVSSYWTGLRLRESHEGRKIKIFSLDSISGLLFFGIQAVSLLCVPERLFQPTVESTLRAIMVLSVVLFLALLLYFIIARDFLYIFAARDLSYALIAVIIPLMVAVTDHSLTHLIESFSGPLYIPERGAEFLAVLLGLVLLAPFQRSIEEMFRRVLFRDVGKATACISSTLENLSIADPMLRDQFIREAMDYCGVEEYCFYAREGRERLRLGPCQMGSATPREHSVSRFLCRFLARRNRPISLRTLPFEWPLFFYQFELFRLFQATQTQLCVPVTLGGNLRGLILVARTKKLRDPAEDLMFGEIRYLGLTAVRA